MQEQQQEAIQKCIAFEVSLFVLFNDHWSEQGHSMLCNVYDHTHFLCLHISPEQTSSHK